MAVVQTAYTNYLDTFVPGQVFDIQTTDIDTGILAGADDVPFGFGVGPYEGANPGDQDVQLGASREQVATVDGAIGANVTALVVDGIVGRLKRLREQEHYVIGTEIVRVTASASASAFTIERGEAGSARAAILNNAAVYLLDSILFRGVAIQDERVPAKNGTVFKTSDAVPVLYRGNVVVPISAAVVKDGHVCITTTTDGTDLRGMFSSRNVDATHILIPGARFIRSGAADATSVVRFGG